MSALVHAQKRSLLYDSASLCILYCWCNKGDNVCQAWGELILAADTQSAIACCQFYLPATPPGGLSLPEFTKTRTNSAGWLWVFLFVRFFIRQFRCLENRLSLERRQMTSDKGPPVKRDFCLVICTYKWNSLLNGTGQGKNKFSLFYTLCKTISWSQKSDVKVGLQAIRKTMFTHIRIPLGAAHLVINKCEDFSFLQPFIDICQKWDIGFNESGSYLNLANFVSLLMITGGGTAYKMSLVIINFVHLWLCCVSMRNLTSSLGKKNL